MQTKDPAYYRDLLDKILQEQAQDDIPPPPPANQLRNARFYWYIKKNPTPWSNGLKKDKEIVWSVSGRWHITDDIYITEVYKNVSPLFSDRLVNIEFGPKDLMDDMYDQDKDLFEDEKIQQKIVATVEKILIDSGFENTRCIWDWGSWGEHTAWVKSFIIYEIQNYLARGGFA